MTDMINMAKFMDEGIKALAEEKAKTEQAESGAWTIRNIKEFIIAELRKAGIDPATVTMQDSTYSNPGLLNWHIEIEIGIPGFKCRRGRLVVEVERDTTMPLSWRNNFSEVLEKLRRPGLWVRVDPILGPAPGKPIRDPRVDLCPIMSSGEFEIFCWDRCPLYDDIGKRCCFLTATHALATICETYRKKEG